MKKILFLAGLFFLLCITSLFGQNPAMSYQAIVRDGNGQLVTNQSVTATIKVRIGSTDIFNQTYNVNTNTHGLLTLNFGDPIFMSTNWENASISCEVRQGSNIYMAENFQPVVAVPLSLYATSMNRDTLHSYLDTDGHILDIRHYMQQNRQYIIYNDIIIHQALEDTAAHIRREMAIMDSAIRSALVDTARDIRIALVDSSRDIRIALVDSSADIRSALVDSASNIRSALVDSARDIRIALIDTAADIRAFVGVRETAVRSALVDTATNIRSALIDTAADIRRDMGLMDTIILSHLNDSVVAVRSALHDSIISIRTDMSGFITTETDPIFDVSVAKHITAADTIYWNAKQEVLTAGAGINIAGTTISATFKTYSIGDTIDNVGIVFYVDDSGQHGLMMAKVDQTSPHTWSNDTSVYIGAAGQGLYAGEMNTAISVASQIAFDRNGDFAAKSCVSLVILDNNLNTIGGWYLPSVDELRSMYVNLNSTYYTSTDYWSSTENTDTGASTVHMGTGDINIPNKSSAYQVRCIRSF